MSLRNTRARKSFFHVPTSDELLQPDPQHVMFGAATATKGANGKSGGIKVAVPASEASAFIKKYGLTADRDQNGNYRTKPRGGIFTNDQRGDYYLVYEPPK